ncbi:MAG: hypothetical protein WBG02_02050 [Candidatus Acidiferrum sp.]
MGPPDSVVSFALAGLSRPENDTFIVPEAKDGSSRDGKYGGMRREYAEQLQGGADSR